MSVLCYVSLYGQLFKMVLHFKMLGWAQFTSLSYACFMGKSLKLQCPIFPIRRIILFNVSIVVYQLMFVRLQVRFKYNTKN